MRHGMSLALFALLVGSVSALAQSAPTPQPTTLPPISATPSSTETTEPPPLELAPVPREFPVPVETPTDAGAPMPVEPVYENIEDGIYHSPNRYWTNVDFLIWRTPQSPLPTALASSAALNAPAVTAYFDTNDLDYGNYNGVRLTGGYWLDRPRLLGIEGSAFGIRSHGIDFLAVSSLTTIPPLPLARPYNDAQTGSPSAVFVGLTGTSVGSMTVSSDSALWGMEANLVRNISRSESFHMDLLGGFRYLDLAEDLDIIHNTQGLSAGTLFFDGAPLPASSSLLVADRFATRNQFYGGQIGARTEFQSDAFVLTLIGKLAFGSSREVITIAGNTRRIDTGSTAPGGLLALRSNIGRYTDDEFAMIPQVGVTVGYRVGQNCRLYAGYDLLYWGRVVRPGDQIDSNINVIQMASHPSFTSLTAGPPPVPLFQQRSFWAQGISLGFELRY